MSESPQTADDRSGLTRRRFVQSGALLGTTAALVAGPMTRGFAATAKTSQAKMPAFPGAEGGGMYTVGGRGQEVYEVTNLDDSGAGSLRDAVSVGNRTVVFRVSGNIDLKSGLTISGSNITIAGQTAPGDGISINRYTTDIKPGSHDIVMRYLRFRLGDVSDTAGDAFDTNAPGSVSPEIHNLIIDHCSFSWAVDECLSPYGNFNVTVQWCIISEGLAMSVHPKGLHGYGGLWGGDTNTYHHNLIVHQGGRNPRFSFTEGMNLTVDHRNNVIYNYGYTTCYGGEWANGINVAGNYYKYGPDTLASVEGLVVTPNRGGQWYVGDNYVDGHPDVTADNTKGITYPIGGITQASKPYAFPNEIDAQSPQDAYEAVLNGAGAILPRRDAVDARVIADARNRTGRMINSQNEVGGWVPLASTTAPVDTDHDGIPDDWERKNGLDPNDPADGKAVGADGYTNLEKYLNSITRIGSGNPTVAITGPTLNQVFAGKTATQKVTITADATAAGKESIAKVEFYDSETKIGTATSAPYKLVWKNAAAGTHYLTVRATDGAGTATTSSGVPIHINQNTAIKPWTAADIGDVPIAGSASLTDGVFTVKGSGKIKGRSDSFHFVYQALTNKKGGQVVEITAKIDSVSRVYNGVMGGLMIRDSLSPDSPFILAGLNYGIDDPDNNTVSGGLKAQVVRIASTGDQASISPYPVDADDYLDLDTPYWIRITRRNSTSDDDSEFEAFISEDTLTWTRIGYERLVMPSKTFYVGMAVDGNKEANRIDNYNTAQFSAVEINH